MRAARGAARAALALCLAGAAAAARAGPADDVLSAVVDDGEREIDLKAGSGRSRAGAATRQFTAGYGLGLGHGVFTEAYALWHQEPGEPRGFDAFEWENRVQLTETGRHAVDVGVLLEIERPRDRSDGYEVRTGLLLQGDPAARLQANLNLLFEKHLRSRTPAQATLGYQWQLKWRAAPAFEPGLQGLGELGPWRRWAAAGEPSHAAGPAAFGRVKTGPGQAIRYNAAWLHGFNDGAPRQLLRLQVEYEF